MSKEAPILLVAGVHDKNSIGWSAGQAWLNRDADNQLVIAARGEKSVKFAEGQAQDYDGRIDVVPGIDWAKLSSVSIMRQALSEKLGKERPVAGVVHAVAWAPRDNFTKPAHKLSAGVYNQAYQASASSLINLVNASRNHIAPLGGVVTYGFSEPKRVISEYGPAMATAKVALSHLVAELAVGLGAETPPARTAEIVTGFIPTYAGRGVLAGFGDIRGKRLRPDEQEEYLQDTSVLSTTDSQEQLRNAGLMTVNFVDDPAWSQTTGQRIDINAGWMLKGRPIFPPISKVEE